MATKATKKNDSLPTEDCKGTESIMNIPDTPNLVSDIKAILSAARSVAATAISHAMMKAYWLIGERIVKEEQSGNLRAEYGASTLNALSRQLTGELGRGFSPRSLRNYRQFYTMFPDWEIWHTRVPNLNWAHIKVLLRVTDKSAREWYMNEIKNQMWSVRTLDRNVSTQYYHRLLASPRKDEVEKEMHEKTSDDEYVALTATQFLKSPYITEFLGLPKDNSLSEKELETALIDHLKEFILELGKGFAFVERQQHIITDTEDYFIDLVFYNYIMKCFVLVDLKTSKITHQDVGQMDMYVRMYDDLKRTEGDNPTIGMLLCAETSQDIARYSILNGSKQLFATKYLTYLPTNEELRHEIESQKELFYLQRKEHNSK